MTIKASCKEKKWCGKCGKEIWSFELRDNRENGSTVHLKGQCPNVMDRPPGNDKPVVVDSIQIDNRKCFMLIGILSLFIYVLLRVG